MLLHVDSHTLHRVLWLTKSLVILNFPLLAYPGKKTGQRQAKLLATVLQNTGYPNHKALEST